MPNQTTKRPRTSLQIVTKAQVNGSRHKAGPNSVFVRRYWKDGEWRVAVTVHAEDQSTPGGEA